MRLQGSGESHPGAIVPAERARDQGDVLVTEVQEMVHRDGAHGAAIAADGGQREIGIEDAVAHDWHFSTPRGTEQPLVVLQPQDHERFRAEADEVEAPPGLDLLIESRGGDDEGVSVSLERAFERIEPGGVARRIDGRDHGPDGSRPAGGEGAGGVVRGVVEARHLGEDARSGGLADRAASVEHPRHGGVRHPGRPGNGSNRRGHGWLLAPRLRVSGTPLDRWYR